MAKVKTGPSGAQALVPLYRWAAMWPGAAFTGSAWLNTLAIKAVGFFHLQNNRLAAMREIPVRLVAGVMTLLALKATQPQGKRKSPCGGANGRETSCGPTPGAAG